MTGDRWEDIEAPQQIELMAYESLREHEEDQLSSYMATGKMLK